MGRAERRPRIPVGGVAEGESCLIRILPCEARVVHAKRLQHGIGQVPVESGPREVLDDLLEIGVSLA